MTTDELTRPAPLADAPFGPDDPRHTFGRAVALASAVIAEVAPDQLDRPTPCDDFDVRAMLGHLVFVLRRVAAIGEGHDPMDLDDEFVGVDEVDDDGWPAAWSAAAHAVQAAWTDDATLDATVTLPWQQASGAETLRLYTNELTVHTWDLATATGQRPAWDDEVLAVADAAIRVALPATPRADGWVPFGAVVEVPDDAPAIDRLVAWNGRNPA